MRCGRALGKTAPYRCSAKNTLITSRIASRIGLVFGSGGILVGNGQWWCGGHGGGDWVVWLLREGQRCRDRNERERGEINNLFIIFII